METNIKYYTWQEVIQFVARQGLVFDNDDDYLEYYYQWFDDVEEGEHAGKYVLTK